MKQLHRVTVVGGALNWMLAGAYVCRVLTAVGAGVTPTFTDRLLLGVWLLMGVLSVVALLQMPIDERQGSSDAPAA